MLQYKEIVVALIAVCGVVFGAVVPVLSQRNKELRLKIADQKREAYAEFLNNFTEIAAIVAREEEISDDIDLSRMHARDQLILYGSDEVIKAYHNWAEYPPTGDHEESALVEKLLWAIRKDVLGKTKVSPSEIANLSSFNRG